MVTLSYSIICVDVPVPPQWWILLRGGGLVYAKIGIEIETSRFFKDTCETCVNGIVKLKTIKGNHGAEKSQEKAEF